MALSVSTVGGVLAHIARAKDVAFSAYVMSPGGPVERALLAARRNHAHVDVTLQRDPYKNPCGKRRNLRCAHDLRGAGAHVTLLDRERRPFHLKAVVCDAVAYFDGVNWTQRGTELVVADDDRRDVALVRDALAQRGVASTARLALRKDDALAREAALIRAAGDAPVTVESEHVMPSEVTRALREHATRHAPTTLIVGGRGAKSLREKALLAALRDDGVDVRETGCNQKLALAGDAAWIGSANATGAYGRGAGQTEWGIVTRRPALLDAVRAALRHDGAEAPRTAASGREPAPESPAARGAPRDDAASPPGAACAAPA